jgi:hypothetical protein
VDILHKTQVITIISNHISNGIDMWITTCYHGYMAHQCNFELDLDGQITCSICGAMDDDMKPSIFESQIDFE